jgi:hypothetical protein
VNGARCRVRTCRSATEHQGLAQDDTQIDALKIRQSGELVEIIEAWPCLSAALKAAVLAIVRAGGGNDA